MLFCYYEKVNYLFVLYVLCNYYPAACQEEEDGPYHGKYLGKFNSYHHQVSGDVYAVDERTLLLKTNVLERYFNKDFTLVLPDKKKITDIKWFAIYDIWSQNTFGDIYIPEGFEPPTVQNIALLTGKTNAISTSAVEILDAKRIRLNQFVYDGKPKKAYFWVGVGAQPVVKGTKVPDDLDPLRAYKNITITLDLPGDITIFNIDWFSIFDHESKRSLASIIIPEALNVPPSLVKIIPHKNELPNCLQLHRDFQVSWEIFGPQITIQLAGQIAENEYLSFGISGSDERSQMIGADVAVAYIDGYRGFATDYNITALTPCVKVLGQYKGVCKDELVGGQDSNQMNTAVRENGINIITYRRTLISHENMEPAFHDLYSKTDVTIQTSPKEPQNNCFAFTKSKAILGEPWKKGQIFDKTIRVFNTYIGPSGGKKGYQAITGHSSTALAWYVNGLLAPELWLRRGLSYQFRVRGGNDPHSAEYYHPLIITDEPHGGIDRRLDDDFESYKKFNRSLVVTCQPGDPGILELTPNSSWPDIIYYNSFTQANMGWKIHVVDSFNQRVYSRANKSVAPFLLMLSLLIYQALFIV
ncbi:unnamed protein product [Callosobruchus maculatus]|uniref:DOMON domain-containing protein n=1 Tax=Callosobruchus maculatus TaxID=64391 RepID=A0A653BRB1_CALMS|nr:unnamed protein product [Callosobruchus maculatus]